MKNKLPQNNEQFHWTSHIKGKMIFYRISEQKIKAIIKSADRREEGIAPNTVAVMKRNDTPKRKEEIWVMYQAASGKGQIANSPKRSNIHRNRKPLAIRHLPKVMISAWRYPGTTKPGEHPVIPDDVLAELSLTQ
jgi:hypothetical protein